MSTVIKSPSITNLRKLSHAGAYNGVKSNGTKRIDAINVGSDAVITPDEAVSAKDSIMELAQSLELSQEKCQELEQTVTRLQAELAEKNQQLSHYEQNLDQVRADAAEQAKAGVKKQLDEKADQELKAATGKIAALLNTMQEQKELVLQNNEQVLVDVLSVSLNKVFGRMLMDEEARLEVIRNAIREVVTSQVLKIRLSPKDHQLLSDPHTGLDVIGCHDSVELVADDNVQLGGCTIESDYGCIDARLETQLEKLVETLKRGQAH